MAKHASSPPATLRTLLERAATQQPERIALRYRRDSAWHAVRYDELAHGVGRVGEALGAFGLEPAAERVALLLDNGPVWVEAYLAATGTGFAVVPLDPKLRDAEVAFILGDAGAALVIADARHADMLARILPSLPSVRAVVLAGTESLPPGALAGRPCHAYAALRDRVPAPGAWYASHAPAPQDVASILYTSGTTGRPKGALLTHNNFCSDVSGALEAIGPETVTRRDDFLVVLPLFHSFSFTANLVLPLTRGCGMFFAESLRTVGDDLRTLRPTILMAVPLLAEKLLARIEERLAANRLARTLLRLGLGAWIGRGVRRRLGGRLRFLVVGGAPCPLPVLHGFRRLGITIIEGYGLTECSPVVSINSLRRPRPGTIGRKLPNITVRIASPDAQGVGELQVRGPVVMKGYFGNRDATREAFDGEWFKTGDLASVDAQGFLTIRGRQKALIVNREGKNIYPEEVEQALGRDPLLADAVVLGYTVGGMPGERVGAIIAPDLARMQPEGAEPLPWEQVEQQVREAVRRQCESLADYKHPRKLRIQREPLERTSIQKVRRCAYRGALDE